MILVSFQHRSPLSIPFQGSMLNFTGVQGWWNGIIRLEALLDSMGEFEFRHHIFLGRIITNGICFRIFYGNPGWKHIWYYTIYCNFWNGMSVQYRPRTVAASKDIMNTYYDIEGYWVAILNWWFGARWFPPLATSVGTILGHFKVGFTPREAGPRCFTGQGGGEGVMVVWRENQHLVDWSIYPPEV